MRTPSVSQRQPPQVDVVTYEKLAADGTPEHWPRRALSTAAISSTASSSMEAPFEEWLSARA